MGRKPSGEWWATVTHAFQAHVREEVQFLEAYERACASVSDPGTRFLIELILEDERRHHELFERLAAAARGGEDAAPPPPRLTADEARPLLETTKRFLQAEREDRSQLRDLDKRLRPAGKETMWRLLVDLMRLDTDKHVKILEYLRESLQNAVGSGA